MSIFACSAALSGCLAIDPVELPEIPDYPPSVVDDENTAYPSTGIVELDFSSMPTGTDPLQLMVVMRDVNITQDLEYRVFVDGTPAEQRLRAAGTVTPSMNVERRVTVEVPIVHLSSPTCHRVELIVSGAFSNGLDQRAPALENDFDSMVWWVRSTDGVTPNVNLQSCPDALTPVFREPS